MDPALLLFAGIFLYLVLALVVQVTWNMVLPKLFQVGYITYVQSLALLILLNVLSGFFGSSCIQLAR